MINKKFLVGIMLIVACGMQTVSAQNKIGYIDINTVIQRMPEAAVIDNQINAYQKDTINKEFEDIVQRYNAIDATIRSGDTAKFTAAQMRQKRTDLEGFAYQIQNWQQISNQATTAKQNQLLEPVYKKVVAAIKAVAKENGYRSVLDKASFIVGADEDDLVLLVLKKLGIK